MSDDTCVIVAIFPILFIGSVAVFHFSGRLIVSYQIHKDILSFKLFHLIKFWSCSISAIDQISLYRVDFPLRIILIKGNNTSASLFSLRLCNRVWGNVVHIRLRQGLFRNVFLSSSSQLIQQLSDSLSRPEKTDVGKLEL